MAVTTGLKQTVYPVRDRMTRYNTHQSDVASPHRSITAAPEVNDLSDVPLSRPEILLLFFMLPVYSSFLSRTTVVSQLFIVKLAFTTLNQRDVIYNSNM